MEGVIPLHFSANKNIQNMRKFKHGFLGRISYYEEFKDVPPTTEERRKQLLEKMKPWEFDPRRPVFVGGKPGGEETCFEYTFTNTLPFPSGVVYYGCCDEDQTNLLIQPGNTETFCAREIVQVGANTLVSSGTSATCSAETPCPPTPPISYEVSISPTGATQYENVILSASTNLSSPTFVWSLTDFFDTSGNTISSYTGSVLTEGYFTSTGSSNVSVVATGDEGSATGSTFSITAFGNIVDEVSGNTWSFSTRQLSTSATNSIRVRRSSDNTEQDIGFSSGLLDTTSLLSFVGTSGTDYGYVVKYYDQSGNNYDMTQTSAADQPTIVSGGTIIEQNNQPTLWIDEPDYMFNSSLSLTGRNMVGFYVARLDVTSRGNGALIGLISISLTQNQAKTRLKLD